jgi:hypothetical protein
MGVSSSPAHGTKLPINQIQHTIPNDGFVSTNQPSSPPTLMDEQREDEVRGGNAGLLERGPERRRPPVPARALRHVLQHIKHLNKHPQGYTQFSTATEF